MGEAREARLPDGSETMTCRTCGGETPHVTLDCESCLARKSYKHMLELQQAYVVNILAGRQEIILTRPSDELKSHMTMVGFPVAWCGRVIHKRWKAKSPKRYPETDQAKICERCREVFRQVGIGAPEESGH